MGMTSIDDVYAVALGMLLLCVLTYLMYREATRAEWAAISSEVKRKRDAHGNPKNRA